jgi:hypothetical protein
MKNAWIVFNRSVFDGYQQLGTIIKFTILWWLCMLPILTFGPATAGLFSVIIKSKKGHRITVKDYFQAVHQHIGIGMKLSLLYLFIMVPGTIYTIILFSNGSVATNIIGILLIYILIIWNLIVLYMFPLMIIQEEQDLTTIVKQSWKLVTENYSFTFNIALYILITTLICSVLTIMLIAWSGLLALISYNSLSFLLHKYNPNEYSFDYNVKWRGLIRPWNN